MHHYVDVKNRETLNMLLQWALENGYSVTVDDEAKSFRSVLLLNRKESAMGHLLLSWKR